MKIQLDLFHGETDNDETLEGNPLNFNIINKAFHKTLSSGGDSGNSLLCGTKRTSLQMTIEGMKKKVEFIHVNVYITGQRNICGYLLKALFVELVVIPWLVFLILFLSFQVRVSFVLHQQPHRFFIWIGDKHSHNKGLNFQESSL